MKRASAAVSSSLPTSPARSKRRQLRSSEDAPHARASSASDAHVPAVSVQRQAARALLQSADLADAGAAVRSLVAKQRAQWAASAEHVRALSRLQTAVELAAQLQATWRTKRRGVRPSVRKKVDARLERLGGAHGRLRLSTATRVDRQAARTAQELESAAEGAADALKRGLKLSNLTLSKEKTAKRRAERGGEDAAERIPMPQQAAATPEPPPLTQMEKPHQYIPSELWRMYERVFGDPRSSHRMRRAVQDVAEAIRDSNPYFFLKTLYRPPPESDPSAQGNGQWEVRRSKSIDAIVTALAPFFHELSYRAEQLLSPDPERRRRAWRQATATLQLVRRLALHFHFVMLHLYAVTMGRHDRKATRWTFVQLVYAAQSDEAAFRGVLGLAEESRRSKDILVSQTFELAPEVLVVIDAWRHQDGSGRCGDSLVAQLGFASREHVESFIPAFDDPSSQSGPSSDKCNAVQGLGLELKQLCDNWASSPLGSGAFAALRIEALGVVEKTIKHRLRAILDIVYKATLARWIQRLEQSPRPDSVGQIPLRMEPAMETSRMEADACHQRHSLPRVAPPSQSGCASEAKNARVAVQHQREEVAGVPVSSSTPAAPTVSHGRDGRAADASGSLSAAATHLPARVVDVQRTAAAAAAPLANATPSESEPTEALDPSAAIPTAGAAIAATGGDGDYRTRAKKIAKDPLETADCKGFRAPVAVAQAAYVASTSRGRSSKVVRGASASQSASSRPGAARILPQRAAGDVVLLKDVYAWTDAEIDAHEREMERVCDVRNELLGLRDALTVVKLEPDASLRLGRPPPRRIRSPSALRLGGLSFAAVSVQARVLSETVAALGEEIAMHGAAEALIKRPGLRAAPAGRVGAASPAPPLAVGLEGSPELADLARTLHARLSELDEPGETGADRKEPRGVSARLAHVGAASLALLRSVNERLAPHDRDDQREQQRPT